MSISQFKLPLSPMAPPYCTDTLEIAAIMALATPKKDKGKPPKPHQQEAHNALMQLRSLLTAASPKPQLHLIQGGAQ